MEAKTDAAIYAERFVLGWRISATLERSGADWLIRVAGGCAPHIGSVSTAWWEEGELRRKTLLLPGHRDDAVSDLFAEEAAKRTRSTVTVVCGIHYNQPGREGIARILECTRLLLEDVLSRMEELSI